MTEYDWDKLRERLEQSRDESDLKIREYSYSDHQYHWWLGFRDACIYFLYHGKPAEKE